MKIIFMGTPEFATVCLKQLINSSKHEVIAVFTQPDKPAGRKLTLMSPAVKVYALSQQIPVFQPENFKQKGTAALIQQLQPDVIVVVAYGQILPKEVLGIPKYGCVNVHASLLPKYRGSAPIARAIIAGETVTGITTMLMDEGLDTGNILLKEETAIDPSETEGELRQRLSQIGATLLLQTLSELEKGSILPQKQCHVQASQAPMLSKKDSYIDWTQTANQIHNLVRGLNPWPCASTVLAKKNLKIFQTAIVTAKTGSNLPPGQIKSVKPFVVQCGNGSELELLEVQCEGKRRMTGEEFARGIKSLFS